MAAGPGYSFGLTMPFNYDSDDQSWFVIDTRSGERVEEFNGEHHRCIDENDARVRCMELNGLDKYPGQEMLAALDVVS